MRLRSIVLAGTALAVTLVGTASLSPAQEATGVVAVRKAVMSSNGAHAAALRGILTDQTQLISHAVIHAAAIRDLAAHLPEMFPEGSDQAPTRALPAVWSDWAGFQERAAGLQQAAANLAEVAATGDVAASVQAFGAVGQACAACHQAFRGPAQ
jgi:cytochrome c556